ncbi:hypothetical protein RhiXN_01965 [Rhizoctonia solani]|uniref:Uncharacterized protein n=1 Tax=Rhizoctonia solani TaxID=456999 RepID=A0A8H8P8S5_9AGAM|nr:uncharacterized protein RhiXN_01965 [Rhizoctonia solani]QRW27370.1 hypothetical protein RhiXN_01965 [Rhizoctonia solani]
MSPVPLTTVVPSRHALLRLVVSTFRWSTISINGRSASTPTDCRSHPPYDPSITADAGFSSTNRCVPQSPLKHSFRESPQFNTPRYTSVLGMLVSTIHIRVNLLQTTRPARGLRKISRPVNKPIGTSHLKTKLRNGYGIYTSREHAFTSKIARV